jgi:hypothetical protein
LLFYKQCYNFIKQQSISHFTESQFINLKLQEKIMPTKPKSTSPTKTSSAAATARIPSAQRFALIPTPRGECVHFSDKLTGALRNISDVIEDNKGTLDSIQDMSLELTQTVRVLRNVVIKYVEKVDQVLEIIAPLVNKMPIFPDALKDFVNDALNLSNKILAAGEVAAKVLPNVEKSLMTADISGLQASKTEMVQLTRSLKAIVPMDD